MLAKAERTLEVMSGTLNTLLDINQLEAGVIRPELLPFQSMSSSTYLKESSLNWRRIRDCACELSRALLRYAVTDICWRR